MKLSVAYAFQPGLLKRLATYPEVKEVYAQRKNEITGGGRSGYTLPSVSLSALECAVREAHGYGIAFNYLLNGASLNGIEQTRSGQRRIRRTIERLGSIGVDALTVASPLLARIIKTRYSQFSIRASAFAMINSPAKARQWEELGADTLCVSAIACNRDFGLLERIRKAVSCELQLIANASCLIDCAYEPTHMQLLSNSSRAGDANQGFCLDYCILHCSRSRLKDPAHYIRSTWIRPEDLRIYEDLGYHYFKILERSCPAELLLKRVAAYAQRSFDGNLLELVGPVAQINRGTGASLFRRFRIAASMIRPGKVRLSTLLKVRDYMNAIIPSRYERGAAGVYIDNKSLDGFLKGLGRRNCSMSSCEVCGYCKRIADDTVEYDAAYRRRTIAMADDLENGLNDGTLFNRLC
ncbi:MAG: peptidase U32 [Chitinivibrionales bacterium]|nr:peptidase U32 [Chitinivibrionales bacterium]MBD3357515.1 peptidase U32 [Chitinivibrionales bacterium]